jgi:hypothetical protein
MTETADTYRCVECNEYRYQCRCDADPQTACSWEPAEITRLAEIRQADVQALGAALSRRDWHATEMAYNNLRDKIDRVLVDLRRRNRPLSEYEQWQHMERGA